MHAQFTTLNEGSALRRKVFGELVSIRQRVAAVCSLSGWVRCDHESVEVELWEMEKGNMRGCCIVPFPPSVVRHVCLCVCACVCACVCIDSCISSTCSCAGGVDTHGRQVVS